MALDQRFKKKVVIKDLTEQHEAEKANKKIVEAVKEEKEVNEKAIRQKLFNYMGNLGHEYFKGEPNMHPMTGVHLKEDTNGRFIAIFSIEFSLELNEMLKLIDIGKGL